jgi:hypothetical protein
MKISSYQEMMDLKKLMDKVGVRNMSDIKDFLSAMTNFGVSSKQLNEFMEQLNRFGVSLATDRSNAYKFLDLLKRYDITYMKGEYDPCLPKFTIFILNLTSDNITFPMYKFTVVPLLKMLNNGVEPTKPPANPDEKRKLNKNMRDLIIRREKAIYTGGDLYQAEYSYTRCNNNQFPDLKNNPPEDGFKKDMAVYKATAEGKAGTAPPFLHELDKTGKEEPSVKLNNDHTKIPNNYKVSPQIIDKRLFYATTLLGNNQDLPQLKPLKRTEQPINFKKIVANLTPYEYAQFKTGKPNLIVPSVMSRLYAKLVSEAKTLRREGEYGRYNSMLDLINYIRILPYYAFRLIAREISSKPSEYDNINSPEYRDFISGVKPFFPENSNIDLSRYAETVDGVMVANMGKGQGMALDQKGAQNQRKTRARGFWRPVVY